VPKVLRVFRAKRRKGDGAIRRTGDKANVRVRELLRVIEKVIGFAVIEKVIINTEFVNKNQDESFLHYMGIGHQEE